MEVPTEEEELSVEDVLPEEELPPEEELLPEEKPVFTATAVSMDTQKSM